MNKLLLKSIFMLLCCMFYLSSAQAQEADPVWTLAKEEQGVKVYYQLGKCDRNHFLILKVESSASSSVSINWSASVGNERYQATSREQSFTINPGEVVVGECLDSRLAALTFAYNNVFENPVVNLHVTL